MSAAKDDNDNKNPELLNQIAQFARPNYIFTKHYVLLLLPTRACRESGSIPTPVGSEHTFQLQGDSEEVVGTRPIVLFVIAIGLFAPLPVPLSARLALLAAAGQGPYYYYY